MIGIMKTIGHSAERSMRRMHRRPSSRRLPLRGRPFRGRPFADVLLPLLAAALAFASFLPGCGERSPLYRAEKALFEARKMREELVLSKSKPEFLEKTIASYRAIVEEYAGAMEEIEGLSGVVISAQIELAELEFRAGLAERSIEDFETAYRIAEREPSARANALYSAAFIGETMGDLAGAAGRYERFHREFLAEGSPQETARMNPRYLVTPLKLADLSSKAGDRDAAARWLREAERIYGGIIDGAQDSVIVKEARFNLLTTHLQQRRWDTALRMIDELTRLYGDEVDLPGLLYLKAKVELDGFKNSAKALVILKSVYERYPESPEAVTAAMTAGGLLLEAKRYDEAKAVYQSVIDEYGDTDAQIAEATWRLAEIAEARGDWLDASLRYKLIYTNYPATIQGLEAPLRIANYYRSRKEQDAAAAAYESAAAHYRELTESQVPEEVRVLSEEYLVRALVEQERWEEAAQRLLELPDTYPSYAPFRENYLKAASIHEHELRAPMKAAEILKRCMDRYPGTDLAAEAERQYRRITGE